MTFPGLLRVLSGLPTDAAEREPGSDVAAWLVQLRWVATVGQLGTVTVCRFLLGVDIPFVPLAAVVAVTGLTNLLLAWWLVVHPEHGPPDEPDRRLVPVLGGVMLIDLALLTALLYLSGGPNNPFYGFFYVNLALAAVVLRRRWAWSANAVAVLGYSLLLYTHRPLEVLPESYRPIAVAGVDGGGPTGLALAGRLVAFVTCSVVVVSFVTRLRDRVRRRGERLRQFEAELARAQKLEALGTLAAGAAHELSTPLSTIAVVAKEVERRVRGTPAATKVIPDVQLIRSELDACRSILDRMSVDAGEAMGEESVPLAPTAIVGEALASLREGAAVRVSVEDGVDDVRLRVPRVRIEQALRGIVHNAVVAGGGSDGVRLELERADGALPGAIAGRPPRPAVRFTVRDRGAGMSPAVLARIGEPFYTTKEPGKGTGLGVFLARAVVERLGGTIRFQSAPGEGTDVEIVLPAAAADGSRSGRETGSGRADAPGEPATPPPPG